ncbi:hypothetical protein KAR10_05700, partial [bacterium]|nr:hypothetical protein [bacterium]
MTANYLKKNILRIGRCTRRTIQNQHRRLIACILVFTFTLTMTGMNTVVAHAWNWQASVNKVKTAAVKAVTATSTYKTVKSSYNSIKIAYSSAKNYKTDALKTASQKVKNNVPAASNRTEAVGKTAPASLAIKPLVAAIPASPISQATDFLSQIIPSPYNPMTDFGKVTSVNVASLSPAISIYPDMQSPSMFGGGTVAKPAETLRPPQIDLNTAATLSGQELPDTQNQLRPTVADQPKAGQTLTTSSASSSQQRANLGAFTNIATKAVSFFSAPIITRAEQVYNLAQNSNNPTIQNLVQGSDHIKQTITQVTGQMLALLQGEKLRPSDGSGVPGVTMALTMLLPTKTSQEDQNQPIVPDKVQEAIDTLPADQIQQQGELAGILGQGALTDQRIQDAQSWINNIPAEQVSMQDVGAALRINQIMGDQVVDPTRLVNSVAEQLNQHARGADWKMNMDTAKPGQINSPLGEIGTVTKNNNGYTLTNSVDTGKGIIEVKINFIPNEKSEQTGFLDNWTYNSKEEPLQVSSVTTTTNYGQQTEQMFDMNKGQLELTATRMTVTVNDPTTAMSFEQNVLVDLNTQKAFYQEQDQIYTIDVNLETGQGMIVSVEGPETRQEALLAIATAESSFRFYGNQAVDFNGKQLAHVEITPEMLQDRGLNQDQRNHLVVGESAILTQDGTIYVGNQDDFRSGNYNVIGRNMFENAGDLGYVATYKNGELDTAKLSNGKEIADISGSRDGRLTGFNVYAEREDGSGEAVSNYQGGNLQGTSLTLNNFIDHQDQNIVLRYDRSGNITPGSLDDLRGGGQDFTFENMDNGGFKLVSTTEGVLTEIYTATGGRVLPGGEGGGGVQPGLIEFNIEKSITMNIAKYNDEKGVDVKLEEVSKHQVMVNLTPGSGLTKTVTQSSVAGEVEIHSTDAWGAGGSDWTRIETQGTQQGLVNGQYVDAKVFTQ